MAVGDISSLPKWAQQAFSAVQGRLRAVEAENAILKGEHPESRVQIGFDGVYLPDRQTIYFRTGDDKFDRIGVRVADGKLHVSGYGTLAIHPSASNTVDIANINSY